MPLSIKLDEITQAVVDVIEANNGSLGFKNIWYGDQELVPSFPSVAVEPGPKTREFSGAQLRTDNNFTVYLLVYHSKIPNQQESRRANVQLAETLEDILLTDVRLGDRLLYSLIAATEPGFAQRGNALLRTTRMTWVGYSKTGILG